MTMALKKKVSCRWTRQTPDGGWGIMGPLDELRQGRVAAVQGKDSVEWWVGTPVRHKNKWIAYVILYPEIQDGGSWLISNWRLDKQLPHHEVSANVRPLFIYKEM